jgi:hypothetical protein
MSTRGAHPLHESRQSLWLVVVSPAAWAVHFVASYATASVWCARFALRDGPLGTARVAIAAYTVAALLLIAATGWRGYRRHMFGDSDRTHHGDEAEDRHRFLGIATVLLSGLSAIATIFTALAVYAFEDCR